MSGDCGVQENSSKNFSTPLIQQSYDQPNKVAP
jgi:hypothetical protein